MLILLLIAIFCTEPFRIPFAGRVDVCCFDKTGTLTGEDLVLEGVSVADANGANTTLIPATEVPKETSWVLASAHALVQLEDGIVGDPMEKETLKALQWQLGAHDTVSPLANDKGRRQNLQIRRRFQFSSALKRQSSVSNLVHPDFAHHKGFVGVKGAPETLKTMFTTVPNDYEESYKYFTRRGSRVIALGYKFIEEHLNTDQVRYDESAHFFYLLFWFVVVVVKAHQNNRLWFLDRSTTSLVKALKVV